MSNFDGMYQSENTDKLYPALFKTLGEVKAITTDSENPHFKSHFASLGATINALEPTFRGNGLLVVQTAIEDSDHYGEKAGVVLNLRTDVIHVATGQFKSSILTVPLKSQDPQQLGSALTYARRYSWQLIAGAITEDDDGNAASIDATQPPKTVGEPPKRRPKKTTTPAGVDAAIAAELVPAVVHAQPDGVPATRPGTSNEDELGI